MVSSDYATCEQLAILLGYKKHQEEGFSIAPTEVWRDARGYRFDGLTDLMYNWHQTFDRLVYDEDMTVAVMKFKTLNTFMASVGFSHKEDEHAGRALCLAAIDALEERNRNAREAVRD